MSLVINEVVHTFDTPLVEYLTLVRAKEVDKLDCCNRILTGSGDTNTGTGGQTLIHKGRALCILVHGNRQARIGQLILAVRFQNLLTILIVPIFIKECYHTAGRDLCNVVLVRLRREIGIQNTLVVHTAKPSKVLSLLCGAELVHAFVVLRHDPLSVIRRTIRDEACRIAQGNQPVPVRGGKADTDSVKSVVCSRIGRDVILDHRLQLIQILRDLIILRFQGCPLNLHIARILKFCAAYIVCG